MPDPSLSTGTRTKNTRIGDAARSLLSILYSEPQPWGSERVDSVPLKTLLKAGFIEKDLRDGKIALTPAGKAFAEKNPEPPHVTREGMKILFMLDEEKDVRLSKFPKAHRLMLDGYAKRLGRMGKIILTDLGKARVAIERLRLAKSSEQI